MVSGEDIPQGMSTVARFLGVELLEGLVDLDRLSWYQDNSHLLAESMSGYIKWLLEDIDTLQKRLSEQFIHFRAVFQKNAAHGRLAEAGSWLMVAFNLFLEYVVSLNVIGEGEVKSLLDKAQAVLEEIITQQSEIVLEDHPSQIFVSALKELFETR